MAKKNEKKEFTAEDLFNLEEKIVKLAEQKGISENYFFRTTFNRYKRQLKIMESLEAAIDEDGPLVEKTYVKDRTNIAIHPAISEYNKTASAANGTVTTLIKILGSFSPTDGSGPADAMIDFLNS